MKWLRINLSEEERRVVMSERESYPDPLVRRKLWTLWLLHCGTTREKTAEIVGVARSTIERHVAEFREGGLEGLRKRGPRYKPTSELAAHAEIIRKSFQEQPARTIAEACQRVLELTGVIRKPTQVRQFLKNLGLKWQRVRAIPVPPKKTWQSTPPIKPHFTMTN
jgi:transposase